MAPTKILFSDQNATPPIFVAGSFTDWQPIEIVPTTGQPGQGQYVYEKTFSLAPGTYQYKFRLGSGDWWVCDGNALKAQDASGNENNLLIVERELQLEPALEDVEAITAQRPATSNSSSQTYGTVKLRESVLSKLQEAPSHATEPTEVFVELPAAKTDGKVNSTVTATARTPKTTMSEGPVTATNIEKKTVPITRVESTVKPQAVTQRVVSQPMICNVDGAASLEQTNKTSDSRDSSVSSLSPQEKTLIEKDYEPEKLSWFSRVFLCGSSRKVMLAAAVVTVPVLLAYVIQE